jgi:hypothetical protein
VIVLAWRLRVEGDERGDGTGVEVRRDTHHVGFAAEGVLVGVV